LIGASGGGESWSYDPETGKLASHSTTTDNYTIRDGQAIRTSSVTNSTLYNKDGVSVIGTQTSTTSYNYQSFEGKWLETSKTTATNSTFTGGETKGSSSTQTTTVTVARDSDGRATGMGMTGSGSSTNVSDMGGTTHTSQTLQNAQAAFDPVKGWYIKSYDWVSNTGA
jgi:hypothetical protein